MSNINFSHKISVQRPIGQARNAQDDYAIIRLFESDRGRIINSAAIRRLQQKTQVFPLERNAAVRSRLTHSLEVQQVGRHIVKEIFHRLKSDGRIDALGLSQMEAPCESMVEMACLMHDIGNPPFGHFGEAAINDWFCHRLDIASLKQDARDKDRCQVASLEQDAYKDDQCQVASLCLRAGDEDNNALRGRIRLDLCHFEGNAQAIRMVHSLLKLNLTYAQVGCILKYTRPAYWQGPVPAAFSYLMKKPGFYLAEEEYVQTLRRELSLGEFHRFPLTYIMEAADDISYCIADLEDAVEKKIFTVEQLYLFLQKEWGSVVKGDLFDNVIGQAFNKIRRYQGLRSGDQFFMYLRVNTVARLVPHAAQRFLDNLAPIYDGSFNQALLEDSSPAFRLLKIFKSVAVKHVFNHPEVEQLELQGYRVISGLLDIYNPLLDMSQKHFQQLAAEDYHPEHPIASRLYHKLSAKHRLAYGEAMETVNRYPAGQQPMMEFYYRARLIQDYISGMTDLYAWDEYRRLMAAE